MPKIHIEVEGPIDHVQTVMAVADITDRGENVEKLRDLLTSVDYPVAYLEAIADFAIAAKAHLQTLCAETVFFEGIDGDALDIVSHDVYRLFLVAREMAERKHKALGTTSKIYSE